MSPPSTFVYADQAIDARVTAYMQGNQSLGEHFAVLKMVDVGLNVDAVATVSYHLVTNNGQDSPTAGYPSEIPPRFLRFDQPGRISGHVGRRLQMVH